MNIWILWEDNKMTTKHDSYNSIFFTLLFITLFINSQVDGCNHSRTQQRIDKLHETVNYLVESERPK